MSDPVRLSAACARVMEILVEFDVDARFAILESVKGLLTASNKPPPQAAPQRLSLTEADLLGCTYGGSNRRLG